MKIFFTYCVLSILLSAGLWGCKPVNEKKLPSLRETYRNTDKLPFGATIAYKGFQKYFYKRTIEITTTSFYYTWNTIQSFSQDGDYSLYFLITKNLVLNNNEVTAIMKYVNTGNDLFISADYIDQKLLDAIYCNLDRQGEIMSEVNGKMHEAHVSMFFGETINAKEYGYYYFPFLNSINGYDSAFTRVLGVNEIKLPNYVVLFSGRGRIYLHVAPRIFGNYFLLTNNNYHYFQNVISYLRLNPKNIYWDEYYKNLSSASHNRNAVNRNKTDKEFSSLSVIKQNPSLLWAFSIAIAGILLFIFFNIKRKQRAIDIIKPNTNSTAAFTQTVGRLYLQQKNNRNIADKMITYFYEQIRNKYFINAAGLNEEFIHSLSGKSGVSKKETEELFTLIKNIHSRDDISDEELLELNFKIENFTKNHN